MTEISSYDLYRGVEGSLQANKPAPNFTLLDGDAKPFKLSDHRGKNMAIAFYPADWSPVCKNEFALFQEALDEIQGYNAELVGISVDSHYSHRAWADHLHISIPLLSDFWPHGAVAQQYGVFLEKDGFSNRALFFVDTAGIIRSSWVAEDPDIAPGLNLVFDALEKLQGAPHEEARHV